MTTTPQLRGALSRADKLTRIRAQREICTMALAAFQANNILDALEIVVAHATRDGEALSTPNLLAEIVENEKGLPLAFTLLEQLIEAADAPEVKDLIVAARTELLYTQGKLQIAEDEMRNYLLDLNRPPGDE
jgi:hypothetical protein